MASFKTLTVAAAALGALGIIVLMALAVTTQFGQILKEDTTIINETIVITSQAGSLANDEVSSVTYIGNTTTDLTAQLGTNVNVSASGNIAGSILVGDGDLNLTYVYAADTEASNVSTSFVTGLAIFGTLIGLVIIAFMGVFVIKLFRKT